MERKMNSLRDVVRILIVTLLFLGMAAGTASATVAQGLNVTINAISMTGISAQINTAPGANITVSFNSTNASTNTWNINASDLNVSINGSGSPNGTIAMNGTFTLNSSVSTPLFNVNVSNAANSSENATLTEFQFVDQGPEISFIDPTPSNGETRTQNYAFINTTVNYTATAFINWDHSLVGWWKMNEAGGTAYDSSGNDYNGTLGNHTSIQGKFGRALSFNGTGDYVGVPDNSQKRISSGPAGTMEAWINSGGNYTAKQTVMGAYSGSDDNNSRYMLFALDNSPGACTGGDWGTIIGNGTAGTNKTYGCSGENYDPTNFPIGTWKHLAVTYNGTNVSFYSNGTLLRVIAQNGSGAGSAQQFSIGRLNGFTQFFNGSIDEVRIHSRALSPEEINASYNAENPLFNNFTNLANGVYNFTAYAQNSNGSVNQTEIRTVTVTANVTVVFAPSINSTYNNKTNNSNTTLTVNASESVKFNVTANQTIDLWNWFKDDANASNNYDNFTTTFTGGAHTVKVNATNNTNGTSATIIWNVQGPVVFAPSINSTYNNKTNNSNTTLTVNASESVKFNVTANQSIDTWNWFKDDANMSNNYDNFTTTFTGGAHTVKVNATNNTNGTSATITWNVQGPVVSAPNINSTYNNKTNSSSLSLTVNLSESVKFNVTANQSIDTWNWFKDDANMSNNYDNFTTTFTGGAHTVKVNARNNTNGTSATITWNVTGPAGSGVPNIISWYNNKTNSTSLSLTVNESEPVKFNVTANQTITTWNWFKDGAIVSNNYDNLTANFTGGGAHTLKVNATNDSSGTSSTITWDVTITVQGSNVSLTNISARENVTTTNVNATYLLNLTNTGNAGDTYTLAVTNDSATVAALNISSPVTIAAGASRIITLYVTNSSNGPVHVNVTATSQNDPSKVANVNTTTYVELSAPDQPTSYNGTVTIGGILRSATINVTAPDGSDVGNTTSLADGSYQVNVKRNDSNSGEPGVSAGQTITFKVNGITAHSRIVDAIGSINTLNLSVYNGTLAGSVLKVGTNIGISGARVNISNTAYGSVIATTDTLGSYRVSLYPGIYNISVSKTGYSNNSTATATITANNATASVVYLTSNKVTVTANRTVGTAEAGQNVSFDLTVVNTGDNATFIVTSDKDAGTIVTNTATPSPLLLNTTTPTGHVVVAVNNSIFGGWPVTITISNGTQSKNAVVKLTAIMRNSSANYTNYSSVIENSTVTGGATLTDSIVRNSNVTGASLKNTTVEDGASVSGNNTSLINASVTGANTEITDGAIITGDYGISNIDNSSIGNAYVDSSTINDSTISDNAYITNSTLTGAIVGNSTLDDVTVTGGSTITNTVGLSNIILSGVIVIGDPLYENEGNISAGTGWVTYLTINFTKIYEAVRISQLVIEQTDADIPVPGNISTAINDTSVGKSMGFSLTVNASRNIAINISETFISPDGAGFSSGTKLGNFLVIRSNDTDSTTGRNHTLRLYFDRDPAVFNDVSIYHYNISTSVWDKLTTTASGTESGRWYREAALNHFSTYALMGTDKTSDVPPPSGGGSSGGSSGGGGGGGGKSSEDAANIELIEKYDLQISKDALTSYRFTNAKNPIMFLNITGATSLGVITASVEVLKATSSIVTVPPEGLVYKNANIWVGTAGFATPKNIKDALITFRIDNAWMSANGVSASDIVLKKWDGTRWIDLETTILSNDGTNSYFTGRTNSFSPFAIVAKVGAEPTVTATGPAGTPTPKPTGTPVPTTKTGGIPIWLTVLIILVIIGGAAYYFLVVKKKE